MLLFITLLLMIPFACFIGGFINGKIMVHHGAQWRAIMWPMMILTYLVMAVFAILAA